MLFLNVYLQIWVVTLNIKAPTCDSSEQSSTTLSSRNPLMCASDDVCWLPVITAPPAHVIIVTADDGSFVPHRGQQTSLDLF